MTPSTGAPRDEIDIVVIGCGVAGAAAAAAAAEHAERLGVSLRIVVLERSGADERGGNSRWTAAYLRMADIDTPAANFVDDLVANGAGHVSRDYAQRLADESPPTLRWLTGKGVEFGELPTIFLTQARPRLLPVGGGRAVLDALLGDAERRDVSIAYETTAWRLSRDGEGAVDTLSVRDAHGQSIDAQVSCVIIASGGFEGSREMMIRHTGSAPRTVAPGGRFNQGEGITMAVDVGARTAGEWAQFHAEPVDPRTDREEAVVMLYPYALVVDGAGARFLDEGSATIDEQYEAMARRLLALPDGRAWVIADQRVFALPRFDDIVQTPVPPVTADSIEELARAIGVPEANLARTVRDYNAAVEPGPFDPLRPDGKRAAGVAPPKSNWAMPVDRPPFVAWPQECSNVFTFGGLDTDLDGRVVDSGGVAIPGLYAAGEVTGLYHGKYTGATSVLRGLVYGRIAGNHAVDYCAARRRA
jgi:tricarballylate dehydrogenase